MSSKQIYGIYETMRQFRLEGKVITEIRMNSATWERLKPDLPDVLLWNSMLKIDETVPKGSVILA